MIQYTVSLNNGIEAFGVNQKTITANEEVQTADEQALAREIAHENPLITASGNTHTVRLLKQSDIFGH